MVNSKPLAKNRKGVCFAKSRFDFRSFQCGLNTRFNLLKLLIAPVIVFSVCSFSGCIVGPNKGIPNPPALAANYFSTDDSPDVATSFVPMAYWWQSFSDEKLNILLARAQHQNPSIREAFERIVAAQASVRLQGGSLKPNGDLLADYGFTKRSQNARPFVAENGNAFDLFTLGLASTWEIDLFGRIARTIEAAEADLGSQEFDFQYIRQTLFSSIASSYLRVRLIQHQIILAEESLTIQDGTSQLVSERTNAGISTKLDQSQTESFRHRSRALKAFLEQQLELEYNQLAVLLGQQNDQGIRDFVGQLPMPEIPSIPGIGIPAELLRRRPDIRRQEMAVAKAAAEIGIAEADLYPQLSLLGTITVSSKNVSGLFETNGLGFNVGPSLSWNVLHFDRINDNISIQESEYRQTVAKYQSVVLQAVREVEDSMIKHNGALNQWSALMSAIESDETAVELSLERYKAGKANFQRVLDAQQQLLDDRQASAVAKLEAIDQLVRLYRSAGGNFENSNCPVPAMAMNQTQVSESNFRGMAPVRFIEKQDDNNFHPSNPEPSLNQEDEADPPEPETDDEVSLEGVGFGVDSLSLIESAPQNRLGVMEVFDTQKGQTRIHSTTDLSSIPVIELSMGRGSVDSNQRLDQHQRRTIGKQQWAASLGNPSAAIANSKGLGSLSRSVLTTPVRSIVHPDAQMDYGHATAPMNRQLNGLPTNTPNGYPLFELD